MPANNCRRSQLRPQADRISAGWKRRHCMGYFAGLHISMDQTPVALEEIELFYE